MTTGIAGPLWTPRLSRNEEDQKTIQWIVFPTNDVAGSEGRDERLLDPGAAGSAVDRALNEHGASIRSWRRPARKVMGLRLPNGAWLRSRAPFGPHPRRAAMLVRSRSPLSLGPMAFQWLTVDEDQLEGGCNADELALLYLYIPSKLRDRIGAEFRKLGMLEIAKVCEDATLAADAMEATPEARSVDLDEYINIAVRNVHRKMNREHLMKQFDEHFHLIEDYGRKTAIFSNFEDEHEHRSMWLLPDFIRAKANHNFYDELDYKKDVLTVKPLAVAWANSGGPSRYVKRVLDFKTTEPVIYTPAGRTLNLFTGWAVEPGDGEFPAIRYLIETVLCDGDEAASEYLFKYLAHMIQKPDEIAKVAIVMQGEQGTGKGTFMRLLRSLVGPKYWWKTSNMKDAIGDYNGSLEGKIVFFFDEALPPNDRRAESRFKDLVSEDTLRFNEKYLSGWQGPNCGRYFLAANQQHVLHVDKNDRRAFVLQVSPRHAPQQTANGVIEDPFWQQYAAAEPGELPAFMRYLTDLDISDFRTTSFPNTAARDVQKVASATEYDRVLRDFLEAVSCRWEPPSTGMFGT